MQAMYAEISLLTDALSEGDFRELKDAQELEFSSGVLKVLHTPGHTPGSCSVYPRSKPHTDLRRLRFKTHHAESGCLARSVRCGKKISIAGGISRFTGENPQLFADASLQRTRRTDHGFRGNF